MRAVANVIDSHAHTHTHMRDSLRANSAAGHSMRAPIHLYTRNYMDLTRPCPRPWMLVHACVCVCSRALRVDNSISSVGGDAVTLGAGGGGGRTLKVRTMRPT